jgi:hypothetical protein
MRTTQEFVTTIIDDFAPQLSVAAALAYLNRAHKRMVNQDCAQNEYLNPLDPTFPYPLLNTTAGTLSYDIAYPNLLDSTGAVLATEKNGQTVSIRRIVRIFTSSGALGESFYSKKFRGEQIGLITVNPYWGSKYMTTWYYEVVGQQYDLTNGTAARWQFAEDPGTHTNIYYVQAYIAAPELYSISTPLFLDGDVWEEALLDGAVGYWEDVLHGNIERLKKFQTYWLPKFCNQSNYNSRTWTPLQMNVRECG